MNNIILFGFNGNELRAIMKDGSPWFLGVDVAGMLGYTNPSAAISKHCIRAIEDDVTIRDSVGRKQGMLIIPESDVWRLIMRSKLPQAQEIEKWVTEEVLPSIRKTGKYAKPGTDTGFDSSAPRAVSLTAAAAKFKMDEQAFAQMMFDNGFIDREGLPHRRYLDDRSFEILTRPADPHGASRLELRVSGSGVFMIQTVLGAEPAPLVPPDKSAVRGALERHVAKN